MYDEHRPRSRERESRRHDSPRRWPDRDDDRSWKGKARMAPRLSSARFLVRYADSFFLPRRPLRKYLSQIAFAISGPARLGRSGTSRSKTSA